MHVAIAPEGRHGGLPRRHSGRRPLTRTRDLSAPRCGAPGGMTGGVGVRLIGGGLAEPVFVDGADELFLVAEASFVEDVLDVRPHRAFADEERLTDLFRGAGRDEPSYLALARREREEERFRHRLLR